jgi:hypothetical protein
VDGDGCSDIMILSYERKTMRDRGMKEFVKRSRRGLLHVSLKRIEGRLWREGNEAGALSFSGLWCLAHLSPLVVVGGWWM